MKYIVDVFDGISGTSYEFDNIDDAKKRMQREREYYVSNKLNYEFIELYTADEDTLDKIETIDMF